MRGHYCCRSLAYSHTFPIRMLIVTLLLALIMEKFHRIAAEDEQPSQESIEILPTDASSVSKLDFIIAAETPRPDLPTKPSETSPQIVNHLNIMTKTAQGGVVFFLHIPKTGGTTVRLNLEPFDHINYIFAKNYSTYWDTAPLVEDAILNGTPNGTILFYEVHATTAPSFFKLRHRLRRWKDTADRNHVPTYFFTLLRESTAYAFSHFNFFHIQRRNPTFEQCNATLDNFLRLTLYNPQCQFLFQGEASMRAQKPQNKVLTQEDCDAVRDHLVELMDWIGTTEHLSNETLPLLVNLLHLPPNHTWTNHKVSQETTRDAYFGKENVTDAVLQWIQADMSAMDSQLYQMVRKHYRYDTFERWKADATLVSCNV